MTLDQAISRLGEDFRNLNWAFMPEEIRSQTEIMSYWPARPDEDVAVCVLKTRHFHEQFHRQDFFFLNYAWQNDYQALSTGSGNLITVRENDCYIGQPFSGYAIRGDSREEIVIVGVLIRKEAFFREYFPALSADSAMFHFFLDPQSDAFADRVIHLSLPPSNPVRALLEMMIPEYAGKKEDTQYILKPLTMALLMFVAREARRKEPEKVVCSLSGQIIGYMSEHTEHVTLGMIAGEFSYHPNYICEILRKETGSTFSEILLKLRMERARALLEGTSLTIEEISGLSGYNNTGSFYRAFRRYYHVSPRELDSRENL